MPTIDPKEKIDAIQPWLRPIIDGQVAQTMTPEEILQPMRIMSWGHGEYIESLWVFANEFLVRASFRAHGHGESYLDIAHISGKDAGKWVSVMDDIPIDFGRQVDKMVRNQLFEGMPPIFSELVDAMKVEITEEMKADNGLPIVDSLFQQCLGDLSMESSTLKIEVAIYGKDEDAPKIAVVHQAMFEVMMDMMREECYHDFHEIMPGVMSEILKYTETEDLDNMIQAINDVKKERAEQSKRLHME